MYKVEYTQYDMTKLENERNRYKSKCDLLQEDIKLLKKNQKTREEVIKQLKHENNNLKQSVSDYKNIAEWHVANWYEYKALQHENRTLQQENKALRLQADEYFELWQEENRKYETLTEHIRLKALHNPSISRYKDLIYFINEMEDK